MKDALVIATIVIKFIAIGIALIPLIKKQLRNPAFDLVLSVFWMAVGFVDLGLFSFGMRGFHVVVYCDVLNSLIFIYSYSRKRDRLEKERHQ